MIRKMINEFIVKVFSYYNGVINKVNYPALLQIEWINKHDIRSIGISTNPNVVRIYPAVLLRELGSNIDGYEIKYNLLETIIHELFHTDQVIYYEKMATNAQYRNAIESQVELQTALYIATHSNEINMFIDNTIIDNDALNRVINRFYPIGGLYHRRTYTEHILIILSEIFDKVYMDRMSQDIRYMIENNTNSKIRVILNDNELVIKEGARLASINQINMFFYNLYFKYSCRWKESVRIVKDEDGLTISIKSTGQNIMC